MKSIPYILSLSLPMLMALHGQAHAQANTEGLELAKAKNCMSCHTVERRVVGPAFKDVAAKYAGAQKDTVDKLAYKVLNGGSGVWGVVAMPANRQVTEAEARQLVGWILTLK